MLHARLHTYACSRRQTRSSKHCIPRFLLRVHSSSCEHASLRVKKGKGNASTKLPRPGHPPCKDVAGVCSWVSPDLWFCPCSSSSKRGQHVAPSDPELRDGAVKVEKQRSSGVGGPADAAVSGLPKRRARREGDRRRAWLLEGRKCPVERKALGEKQ